ncbi:MAG: hypothetical protein A2W31_13470 [Planctomycetes bacterium RBG_16_64_10]|nr:MAG: hypothetical protein A2W31_13470 [Planctomycetes bacterium RBG_16_64_10]
MNRISSTIRITIGLACLAVTVILGAQTVGLVPDERVLVVAGRAALCEAIAVHCSLLASRHDTQAMRAGLAAIVSRNRDIEFIGVRPRGRPFMLTIGTGGSDLQKPARSNHEGFYLVVPIMANDQQWGSVEVAFQQPAVHGWRRWLHHPTVKLVLFVGLASLALYFLYLRKLLQDLDPSKVIPERVRATLDTFAEGLLVLDKRERIVLANQAFAKTVGRLPSDLQGRRVSELPWNKRNDGGPGDVYPWQKTMLEGTPQTGALLDLRQNDSDRRTFLVNTTPILGNDGQRRGALASFDDVTSLQNSRTELLKMLQLLKTSRDEVRRKNHQLQLLANRDPLTNCLNRRSFFEQFENHWSNAQRYGYGIACVMVDIDRFKSINDNHGHNVGDQVLQKVAATLQETARDGDVICRYGGEEFSILFPHLEIDNASAAAERHRRAIESIRLYDFGVTASFGVSTNRFGAQDPHQLIDQADRCLYVAKRSGRNQVVRWDDVPTDLQIHEQATLDIAAPAETETKHSVPFHAVTALISALAYRDSATAEHSRRVADLCVALASQLMSASRVYVLETAALLHDVGKIGVPDSILLKPGPLTEQEWKVMRSHDRVGVGIIRSSFRCEELATIIESHHGWYGGHPDKPDLPTGRQIPLSARVLTIADAFDAMTSDRVYRKGRNQAEAFAELRRCAGTQFDPELVEQFVDCVVARDQSRAKSKLSVSKQTALGIGLQIESLASAMDHKDVVGIAAHAGHLRKTATMHGVHHIAQVAAEIEQLAADDADPMKLAQLTNDLLELCRATQTAYLNDDDVKRGQESFVRSTDLGSVLRTNDS